MLYYAHKKTLHSVQPPLTEQDTKGGGTGQRFVENKQQGEDGAAVGEHQLSGFTIGPYFEFMLGLESIQSCLSVFRADLSRRL